MSRDLVEGELEISNIKHWSQSLIKHFWGSEFGDKKIDDACSPLVLTHNRQKKRTKFRLRPDYPKFYLTNEILF